MVDKVQYVSVCDGDSIPVEYEWENSRESAEEQALVDARANNDIYHVYEITVREVARTRNNVVLDSV